MTIRRVFVANRGEIATRILKACRELDLETVVSVSEPDRESLAAELADRSVCIGPGPARLSYLNQQAIVSAALAVNADAVHPGYGFLAENAGFASLCEENGLQFVGPSGDVISKMGDKLAARQTAQSLDIPLVPGSDKVARFEDAKAVLDEIGYPALLKAAAGGGGRGIRIVRAADELQAAFGSARAEADAAFGEDTIYIERYVKNARHIEVQIFGDGRGHAVHFGDRDCSAQRRYQKIIEEAPAIFVPDAIRESMRSSAVKLAKAINYANAGTVEFLYDIDRDSYYFLEMNTRIQVEHPVTEEVCGVDLVQLQLRVAAGEPLGLEQDDIELRGHAIECRITAEAPEENFRPAPGDITVWEPPSGPGVRLDSHCFAGYRVPPFYDSLLGKLITYGKDRTEAIARMRDALADFKVGGLRTNIDFLRSVVSRDEFLDGSITTQWIEREVLVSE